jgi:hypothetical protein
MAQDETISMEDKIQQPDFGKIALWVIYDHPKDMPDCFVARKWLTDRPTEVILKSDSLEVLRSSLPHGLHRLPRHINDDPSILEVWL